MIKSNFGGHGVIPGSYGGPIPNAPMEGQQSASNSNSANGGSVNSQDSLWNVKVKMLKYLLISMMMVVEFHSEAGGIQKSLKSK